MSAKKLAQPSKAFSVDEMASLWCLYNTETGLQMDGLRLSEVKVVVQRWEQDEREKWKVWMEGWSKWEQLTDVAELNKPPARRKVAPPPIIKDSESGEELREEFVIQSEGHEFHQEQLERDGITQFTLTDLPAVVDGPEFVVRNHRRIQKKLTAILEMDANIFKTQTVDVSAGGVLFQDNLPDWVVGYCRLTLRKQNKKEEVRLMCSMVEDQQSENRRRVELSGLSQEDERRLMVWLAS